MAFVAVFLFIHSKSGYTMKLLPLFFTAFFGLILVYACSKDEGNSSNTTQLQIHLIDGPGDYQQVNVDIQEIRVKMSDDTSQWISVPTYAGVYNLLDFQNGVDTLIAAGPVPLVILKEMRLILGPNNTIMVDSVLHDLETPSAEQSGLKIKVDKNLSLTLDSLTIDFDAKQSIVETGNGKFILKPVIRVKN